MPTYAIGDIQGCFDELQALLTKINFDPQHDTLWFCGDLVNRGPKSLEVLRFVQDLGEKAITVLGNHDLHLLAIYYQKKKVSGNDSLLQTIQAEDAPALMNWLKERPLAHYDPHHNCLLIHAGLAPQWGLQTAIQCAEELQNVLRHGEYLDFFANMYGDLPNRWEDGLQGWDRLRFIVNTFTRLRYCDPDGHYAMKPKGAPGSQPDDLIPWFEHPDVQQHGFTTLFGHWSTLGVHQTRTTISLDSGCLWGGSLTALRLEDRQLFSLPCRKICPPGKE